jgi:hypothetical protein
MDTIFVKPARAEILVPNPENANKPLAVEGEAVYPSRYWNTRAKDGDVIISAVAPKSKSKKKD